MTYELLIQEALEKKIDRLKKRNPRQLLILNKKVIQVLENPYHYKPLRGDMHNIRRVHIDKSFVLIYEIDEPAKAVKLLDLDHHDKIYTRR